MPAPASLTGRIASFACVALGSLSFLAAHALALAGTDAPLGLSDVAVPLALLAVALAHRPALAAIERVERQGDAAEYAPYALQLVLLAQLTITSWSHGLLVALIVAQANLAGLRRTSWTTAWMIALTPLVVLAAMSAAPGGRWLFVLPIALLVMSAALVELSLQRHRERIELRSPRAYRRAWSAAQDAEALRGEQVARLGSAARLTLALLLLLALLYPLLVVLPRPTSGERTDLGRAAREAAERRSALGESNRGGGRQSTESYPGDLRPGGKLSRLDYERLMTVLAYPPGGWGGEPQFAGPLYMRAITLDTFTETGLRSNPAGRMQLLSDGDDGRRDGWTRLASERQQVAYGLEVRHNALRVSGSEDIVLFAPQATFAIELPAVRHDPERMLALPRGVDVGEVEFALRVAPEPLFEADLERVVTGHPDPRYLQQPEDSDELDYVTREAQRLVRGAPDDYSRVERIQAWFRDGFDYSTNTVDVPGLEGIVHFLRRRKGHCTSFAAAATLMLRTQGIPARVATGFLAEDWQPDTGMYVVSRKNGHAWIEVHFEGRGWQTFEVTPTAERSAALAAAEAGEDDGLANWASDLRRDLSAWAESGADEGYLGLVLDRVRDLPRALIATLQARPWLALVALSFVLSAFLIRRAERRRVARAERGEDEPPAAFAALLDSLARRGHRRAPARTLRDWLARVELPDEEALRAELLALGELSYRDRFGGAALGEDEAQRVLRWVERYEASLAAPSS